MFSREIVVSAKVGRILPHPKITEKLNKVSRNIVKMKAGIIG